MPERIIKIIKILENATKGMTLPMTHLIRNDYGQDPFLILMSCLLSLRSRDTVTYRVCKELFTHAHTPEQFLTLPIPVLEHLIASINFYRRKAVLLHSVSHDIITRFGGSVPSTREELLSIKGVGPKTAALVLAEGFDIPAICVDTHVHRISNRLGLVSTKTPEQTEKALMQLVPVRYWCDINRLFVMWGQNICVPISPFCSRCALFNLCERVDVTRSR